MKSILAISIIALTLGALYLSQSETQVPVISKLTAYEDDLTFEGQKAVWNLEKQSIGDDLLTSICKTIERRLTSMAPHTIREFEMNLRENNIRSVENLFKSISRGLGSTLYSLKINLDQNLIKDVDVLESWDIPAQLTSLDLSFKSTRKDYQNIKNDKPITSMINRFPKNRLTTFKIDLFYNERSAPQDIVKALIENQHSLAHIKLDFGNYSYYTTWKNEIAALIKACPNIQTAYFGLYQQSVNKALLNDIEYELYNLKHLKQVTFDLKYNSLSKNEVNEIFEDLRVKNGQDSVIHNA